MKALFFAIVLCPIFLIGQDKSVIRADRLIAKQGKVQEFEKLLSAHAKTYHTGTFKWRVYKVASGPDAGAYHITEGPMSWDDLDTRGDLGKVHQSDWDNNVSALLAEKGTTMYSVYRQDLSAVALNDFSNKIAINHVYPKPGYTVEMEDAIKKLKKTWESSGQSVAVYEASSSGPQQYVFVTRYKQGLKERNTDFRKPMKERFNLSNGENAWDEYVKGIRTYIDHSWSELLFYHPELSSN